MLMIGLAVVKTNPKPNTQFKDNSISRQLFLCTSLRFNFEFLSFFQPRFDNNGEREKKNAVLVYKMNIFEQITMHFNHVNK